MNTRLSPASIRGTCILPSLPFNHANHRLLSFQPSSSDRNPWRLFNSKRSFFASCTLHKKPSQLSNTFTHLRTFSRTLSTSITVMATNGEARPKRRGSPSHALERPSKHLKPDTSVPTPGDATPQNGTVYSIENEVSTAPIMNALGATTDSPEWQATIENVIKSVVSIHFCQTCSFDTDLSMSSQATGFVVDAERGYILTNRHVVCSGPFWGYCLFENHEEVIQKRPVIPRC